jgi:hypothetical protein
VLRKGNSKWRISRKQVSRTVSSFVLPYVLVYSLGEALEFRYLD